MRTFVTRRPPGVCDGLNYGWDVYRDGKPTGEIVTGWVIEFGQVWPMYVGPDYEPKPCWEHRPEPVEQTFLQYIGGEFVRVHVTADGVRTETPVPRPASRAVEVVEASIRTPVEDVGGDAPTDDMPEPRLQAVVPRLDELLTPMAMELSMAVELSGKVSAEIAAARVSDSVSDLQTSFDDRQPHVPPEDRYFLEFRWNYGVERYPLASPKEAQEAKARLEGHFRGLEMTGWRIIHEQVRVEDLGWPT